MLIRHCGLHRYNRAMHAPPFRLALLAFRQWPVWLGLGLMRFLHILPIRVQLRLGEWLGFALGRIAFSRRNVVRANLRVAFPLKTVAQHEALIDEHFAALGRGLFEAVIAWWSSDSRIRALGEVVGLEHYLAVKARGQGALLLTGHFTTLELGARFLTLAGVDFHAMYRPYDNPVMDYFMHRWLREGRAIWYAPDQTLDARVSVFVPFFGKNVSTIVATSKLAQTGRAAVVPYFPHYLGKGRYQVFIEPALAGFPGPDEVADAARINQVLEAGIIAHAPAEYFWVHRRFKAVPEGEKDIYA